MLLLCFGVSWYPPPRLHSFGLAIKLSFSPSHSFRQHQRRLEKQLHFHRPFSRIPHKEIYCKVASPLRSFHQVIMVLINDFSNTVSFLVVFLPLGFLTEWIPIVSESYSARRIQVNFNIFLTIFFQLSRINRNSQRNSCFVSFPTESSRELFKIERCLTTTRAPRFLLVVSGRPGKKSWEITFHSMELLRRFMSSLTRTRRGQEDSVSSFLTTCRR